MKNQKTKDLEYYLGLPYTIVVRRNEDGSLFAEVEELPGCMTEADDPKALLESIRDAQAAWIKSALEDGIQIPMPRSKEEFSGRFLVRIPKSLHRDLVRKARRESVSLNQLATAALAKFVTE